MSNQPTILMFEGVSYVCRCIGGRGWTIGCGSIVEAIDGPNKGKLYMADIWGGIHRISAEISNAHADGEIARIARSREL